MKKNRFLLLAIITGVVLLSSCGKNTQTERAHIRQEGLRQLKQAERQVKELSSVDEMLTFWKKRLIAEPFRSDSVLEAKIHYQLAGTYYAKNSLDSIKWHMQRAWDLMERQQGYEEIKVLLNSGEGNIATTEQQMHQANYYFNQAAQILTADTSLDLTPRQKANVYLATAQTDAQLYQFEHAIDRNRKAMFLLLSEAPDEIRLLYRVYSQLAAAFTASGGSTDSVYTYIRKMEHLYAAHPGKVSLRFLYDRKALYFEKIEQPDSTLFYQQKVLHMDQEILDARPDQFTNYANVFKDYANLAATYARLGRLNRAKYYLDRGAAFTKEHGDYLDDGDDILYRKNLTNYLFATEQYQKTYKQVNVLFEAYERLYENEYAQAIAEMSAIYQLEAKEKSILQLNEQVLLTESRLKQNQLLLIITTLSTLLAIAIAILLYGIQKQRKLLQEREKVQLQKNAIELEQRLLRTQMEPHFIFNTLSALQSFVRLDKKEKALKYLKQFSRLLRSSLELSRKNMVPLDEEIDTLECYLSLQQMRYDNGFDYQIHPPAADNIDQIFIPPMLIQPFVENAVIHGVHNVDHKGLIRVEFTLQDKTLWVTITDNGPGVNTTLDKPRQQEKSLSTIINRERLEILAREEGMKVDIEITDRQQLPERQTGTIVELAIPVTKEYL